MKIGDRNVSIDESAFGKEILIENIISFTNNKDGTITATEDCDQYFTWDLSKEELCTFIKLLVSHLELPLEFK